LKSLRKKTTATLLIAAFIISAFAFAVTASPVIELGVKGDAVSEMSTGNGYGGGDCVHLQTLSTPGTGDEGRIVITMPSGFTLGQLDTISWYEYLVTGYPPHVDVFLDINDDDVADESLNFEYAYNDVAQRYPGTGMPYGALTGAWYQTFGDDGKGPVQIDDDALAWPNSGPPGPPSSIQLHSLATWKAGVTITTGTAGYVSSTTEVLRFEIEVDNWVVQTEAFVDDVEINGIVYDFETSASTSMETVVREPIISIMVDPMNINFGTIVGGQNSETVSVRVTNIGEISVDVTTSIIGTNVGFYSNYLWTNGDLATDYVGTLAVAAYDDLPLTLKPPEGVTTGTYEATLVFWAEAS
jgi:hypothetical protein